MAARSGRMGGSRSAGSFRFLELAARCGYTAKGFVYVLVGGLSAWAALGDRARSAGTREALQHLLVQPFGRWLLGVIALGLAAYVVWRSIQAVLDPELSSGEKSLFSRLYAAISAVAYALLTAYSARMAWTARSQSDESTNRWMSFVPDGWTDFVLLSVAVGFLVAALRSGWVAVRASYRKRLELGGVAAPTSRWLALIARSVLLARSVVFAILGFTFLQAAGSSSTPSTTDTGDALQQSASLGGPLALGALSLGMLAYGLYQWIKARYRRIEL